MRVLPAGFFDDEPDALGGFPGGSGAFLAAQHRNVRPHGPGDAQGGLPAQFHGAGLSEVLRDDRLHDELRAHQGIGDGEGIVRLARGIRVDHDPDLFAFGNIKIQHNDSSAFLFETAIIIHAFAGMNHAFSLKTRADSRE